MMKIFRILSLMFIVGEAVVEDDVATARFACDCANCKGACCTLAGGRGAPLTDEEADEIERVFPIAKKYLSKRSLDVIEAEGMVEGISGHYYTVCIGNKDCVFVFYEDGIARCALEKAFLDGLTDWRKPISCHLFPIRIDKNDTDRIRYERIRECETGRSLGERQNIPLYEYLKEPLIRAYGEEWYSEFQAACLLKYPVVSRENR